jgi:hypothetical protein
MLQLGPGSVGEEKGEVADDEVVVVRPSQVPTGTSAGNPRATTPALVMVVGARNRAGNGARRMARLKTRGPGGSGEGLRSSLLS